MIENEDKKTLKVGIIGTGFGSVGHFPSYRLHNEFTPVAISGNSKVKTKKIANNLGIETYTTNWKEFVQNDEIDVISIASPPHQHKEMALEAIEHGKHVLCEKPLALNTHDATEMLKAVEESGLTAMLDLEFRYIPSRAYLIDLINNNYIGEIYNMNIRVKYASRLNPRLKGYDWWSDKTKGGGVLNALGSHYIDFLLLIFNQVESVCGRTSINISKRLNKLTGRMKTVTSDDAFLSTLKINDNTTVSLEISSTTPYGRGPRIEIFGSEGALIMREDQQIFGGKMGEDEELKPLEIPKIHQLEKISSEHSLVPPFMRLLDEFYKGIQTGRSPHPNFNDGVKIQQIIDAIRESEKRERWIQLKD